MDRFSGGERMAFVYGLLTGTVLGTLSWWLWLITTRMAAGV